MQKIQQFESLAEGNTSFEEEQQEEEEEEEKEIREIEEKAKQLLSNLKETINLELIEDCEANNVDELLFDFFWHELFTTRKHQNNDGESDEKLTREAKFWINGDYNGEFEWEIEDKRESYIRDMEREARWNKFEEEKQELSLDLEFEVFNDLVHEVLEDVFSHKC